MTSEEAKKQIGKLSKPTDAEVSNTFITKDALLKVGHSPPIDMVMPSSGQIMWEVFKSAVIAKSGTTTNMVKKFDGYGYLRELFKSEKASHLVYVIQVDHVN